MYPESESIDDDVSIRHQTKDVLELREIVDDDGV